MSTGWKYKERVIDKSGGLFLTGRSERLFAQLEAQNIQGEASGTMKLSSQTHEQTAGGSMKLSASGDAKIESADIKINASSSIRLKYSNTNIT